MLWKLSSIIFFLTIIVYNIYIINIADAFAQDQQNIDNYEMHENNDPLMQDPLSQDFNQNPDPGFMEEIEPGEYNQSDDTTELDDNY